MKLSCLQENLSKGLSIVGSAVASRTTLPITNNVLLSTDESRLKLSATNLEMAITHWVGAKIEEEGGITVPYRLFNEFVNSLPKGEKVDMKLVGKTLELRCARFEARISGVDAADFPPIPKVDDGIKTKVDTAILRQAIIQVAFAAATEESRPVLTGIDAQFDGANVTLAAADGFRLAVYRMPLATAVKEKAEVIIPSRTLNELKRLIEPRDKDEDNEEPIDITVNPNKSQILFRMKKTQLVSQLVQGTFPKYSQLIPQNFASRTTVSAEDFLKACKMASIFARDGSGIVRLIMTPGGELAPGKITISSKSEELGEDIGEIDAFVEGQETKIAFNGKYLTDVLSIFETKKVTTTYRNNDPVKSPDGHFRPSLENASSTTFVPVKVTLETTNPSSPGVIKPVGSDNYLHVVMPMFVQW
jgi:DNA polymerase-3 subunit beta